MFSLWLKIRNLFLSLLRPSQRRASKRPARRRLFAEPLESRAVPSAGGGLGGGGPLGGRGKSILAPGQGSLTLENNVLTQGQSGPGSGGEQTTQPTSGSGSALFRLTPSGPGYPLPSGNPPLGGGVKALDVPPGAPPLPPGPGFALPPPLTAVFVPFEGTTGALPFVPTQSTSAPPAAGTVDAVGVAALPLAPLPSTSPFSIVGNIDAVGAPALNSVPTQATFALPALGSVTAVGQPSPTSVPTQATFALPGLGNVDTVLPSPRFDAPAVGQAPASEALVLGPSTSSTRSAIVSDADINRVAVPVPYGVQQEALPTNPLAHDTPEPLTQAALGPQGRSASLGAKPEGAGANTESFWSILVSGSGGSSGSPGPSAPGVHVSSAAPPASTASTAAAGSQGNLDRADAGAPAPVAPSGSLAGDATADLRAYAEQVSDAAPATAAGEQLSEYAALPILPIATASASAQAESETAGDSAPATTGTEQSAPGGAEALLLVPALLAAKTWWVVSAQRTPVSLETSEEKKRGPRVPETALPG